MAFREHHEARVVVWRSFSIEPLSQKGACSMAFLSEPDANGVKHLYKPMRLHVNDASLQLVVAAF